MTSTFENPPHPSETRFLFIILFIYFFICFPLSQIYLKDSNILYKFWNTFFFVTALTVLFLTGKLESSKLGKIHSKHLILGLGLGILPIITVVLLDTLITITGMVENNLFSGAELRKPESFSLLLGGLLNPIASQLFITGYILKGLIRDKTMAIPGNGILYSAINFNLGIGYLVLGMISAGLLRLTGSLIPAILFSVGCALAKILIITIYPRVTTILVFLI